MRQPRAFFTASAARAVTMALIALRAKAVAVLLGPEGTGLLGLFTAAQEIGAQAADAGLSHSAVRQLARTADRPARAARLRRVLALAVVALALAGAMTMFLTRAPLSLLLTGTAVHAPAFGALSLGLFLTVLFRWRQALLTGYRQLGALAGGTVLGTGLAVAAGVGVIWVWGRDGLVWAAVLAPAAGLIGLYVAGRLPVASPAPPGGVRDLGVLLRLGGSLMLVAQMALIAPMVLRVWLTHQEGLAEAGLFQAAWTVAAQLMAVLLMAVGVDFYPRISAMMADRAGAARLLDRQIGLHLSAGGPVLLLTAGLAPWILTGLYAHDFAPAAPLLQGLALGSMARLIASPVEAALTAAGRPRTVLAAGSAAMAVLLAGALAGAARWGLAGIGAAYALAQLVHLVLLCLASARQTGLVPGRVSLVWLSGLMLAALALSASPPGMAVLLAVGCAALAAAPGLAQIEGIGRASGPAQRFLGWTSTAGRRSSAALNRLKVWLT